MEKLSRIVGKIIPQRYLLSYHGESERSKRAINNIIVSMVMKCVSILTSFLVIPLTIDYVNPTQYGIWLTISSVISWISYFNLGLGNGFRNRFAEAKAKGDIRTAREYLSTTYFAISLLVIFLFLVSCVFNHFVDWTEFLKIDSSYSSELSVVFSVVSLFFCINMIVNIFDALLLADQKPGLSSVVQTLGQVFSLLSIFLLTRFSTGSLSNLAIYYSGVPCLITLLASVFMFRFTGYRQYSPGIRYIRPKLIKSILNLGIQFFFINVCLVLIFQVINIIISRELGPDAVTEYNIAYKYFNILYMGMLIIITPFWSAFTDAFVKKDFLWMKNVLHKLEKIWLCSVALGVVMLCLSSWFYRVWIGDDKVLVPLMLSFALLVYMLVQTLGAIYMHLINGIGTIRLQLIIYIFFALISWPLVTYSCRTFGVYGAVLSPVSVYLVQAVFAKIQLGKILSQSAAGIWKK